MSEIVNKKRGEVMLKIFDALANTALAVPAIITGILEAGYGASSGKMRHSIQKQMDDIDVIQAKREEWRRRYQRYSTMLRYLKVNGLVAERRLGDSIKLYLTEQGRKKRAQLREEIKTRLPISGYKTTPGKKIIIVTYDIPVDLNRYRDWLRAVLNRLGLKKLQQSVWVGKVFIPREFLDDILKYKIEEYIEIVEVGNAGIMREIL